MTGSSSTRRTIVFYSKDYRKVKILHYDINGWILCLKWFTDAKSLKRKTIEIRNRVSKIEEDAQKQISDPNFPEAEKQRILAKMRVLKSM